MKDFSARWRSCRCVESWERLQHDQRMDRWSGEISACRSCVFYRFVEQISSTGDEIIQIDLLWMFDRLSHASVYSESNGIHFVHRPLKCVFSLLLVSIRLFRLCLFCLRHQVKQQIEIMFPSRDEYCWSDQSENVANRFHIWRSVSNRCSTIVVDVRTRCKWGVHHRIESINRVIPSHGRFYSSLLREYSMVYTKNSRVHSPSTILSSRHWRNHPRTPSRWIWNNVHQESSCIWRDTCVLDHESNRDMNEIVRSDEGESSAVGAVKLLLWFVNHIVDEWTDDW